MGMGSVLCKVNPYDEDISKTRDLGWYPRMDLEMSPTYDHHSHSHLLILCPSLPLLRNSWNSYNIPSLFYSWSDIHGYKLFLQIPQEISPMMCVCVCVCVCVNQGWSQVKVYDQLVWRGDPPKDSVCSVVHLSKAPLIITFFLDNVFVSIEMNPGGQPFY
jgi:hypothetical protein